MAIIPWAGLLPPPPPNNLQGQVLLPRKTHLSAFAYFNPVDAHLGDGQAGPKDTSFPKILLAKKQKTKKQKEQKTKQKKPLLNHSHSNVQAWQAGSGGGGAGGRVPSSCPQSK